MIGELLAIDFSSSIIGFIFIEDYIYDYREKEITGNHGQFMKIKFVQYKYMNMLGN